MRGTVWTAAAAAMVFSLPALAGGEPAAPAGAVVERAESGQVGSPISSYTRVMYEGMKSILLRTAEKTPEEVYGFRPTDGVRSFGQILGHVADAQYLFGSLVLGEENPAPGIEKSKTSKADLIAALKDAFAYCDRAYGGMTDAAAAETVRFFGGDAPKLGPLMANTAHALEHYGNLVTYMRMNHIVPPTSEPGFLPARRP